MILFSVLSSNYQMLVIRTASVICITPAEQRHTHTVNVSTLMGHSHVISEYSQVYNLKLGPVFTPPSESSGKPALMCNNADTP